MKSFGFLLLMTACVALFPFTSTHSAEKEWIDCAGEGQVCKFSGTRAVRYGVNGKFAQKHASDFIHCSNEIFGFVPGSNKRCFYASSETISKVTQATPQQIKKPKIARKIEVLSATYGKVCGAGTGNASYHLSSACNGKVSCSYALDHRRIGDPTPGCAKDFLVSYSCDGEKFQASLSPEASGKNINLTCDSQLINAPQKVNKSSVITSTQSSNFYVETVNGVKFKMMSIPGGSFMMGSSEREQQAKPIHKVSIIPFYIAESETTWALYQQCINAGQCGKGNDNKWGRGNRPVVQVSWIDVTNHFLPWLNQQTNKVYRLPSETEWEYAARAGSVTKYSWGDDIGQNKASCSGCGSQWDNTKTAPVKSFSPNIWGLYDMHGNVREWVQDCYNRSYKRTPRDNSALKYDNCTRAISRGGSFHNEPSLLRSSDRFPSMDLNRRSSLDIGSLSSGFRLAHSINDTEGLLNNQLEQTKSTPTENSIRSYSITQKDIIAIMTENGEWRLDIGATATKKLVTTNHESWATRLVIRRLDGPSEGRLESNHVFGVFSENGKYRLDIGQSIKKTSIDISDSTTKFRIKPLKNDPNAEVHYGDLVGIYSSDMGYRLDIGKDTMKRSTKAKHDSWATRFKAKMLTKDAVLVKRPLIQICQDMMQRKISRDKYDLLNTVGTTTYSYSELSNLCKGTKNPKQTVDCYKRGISKHNNWKRAINECGNKSAYANTTLKKPKPKTKRKNNKDFEGLAVAILGDVLPGAVETIAAHNMMMKEKAQREEVQQQRLIDEREMKRLRLDQESAARLAVAKKAAAENNWQRIDFPTLLIGSWNNMKGGGRWIIDADRVQSPGSQENVVETFQKNSIYRIIVQREFNKKYRVFEIELDEQLTMSGRLGGYSGFDRAEEALNHDFKNQYHLQFVKLAEQSEEYSNEDVNNDGEEDVNEEQLTDYIFHNLYIDCRHPDVDKEWTKSTIKVNFISYYGENLGIYTIAARSISKSGCGGSHFLPGKPKRQNWSGVLGVKLKGAARSIIVETDGNDGFLIDAIGIEVDGKLTNFWGKEGKGAYCLSTDKKDANNKTWKKIIKKNACYKAIHFEKTDKGYGKSTLIKSYDSLLRQD
ncbi:MAG: SUMF1/EgtB/PvdO family nonheme iron enzyme [Colwellia sp.]|nr:SUMF1/EgtB/PvdO family nonheme iron enzyme [Colwellia sp.]